MLSVAGSFSCSSFCNFHCYGGKPATCFQRCVLIASLCGRLWLVCHAKVGIPCCVATSPVRFIPSDAIQSPHQAFSIVLKLRILQIISAGSFNCPFLVLSFSQVLTLNVCYALRQTAEIFAAFRSISQHFAADPEKKVSNPIIS